MVKETLNFEVPLAGDETRRGGIDGIDIFGAVIVCISRTKEMDGRRLADNDGRRKNKNSARDALLRERNAR